MKFKVGDQVEFKDELHVIHHCYDDDLYELKGMKFLVKGSELKEVNVRESVLREALSIVLQDRNLDYGSPESNFSVIAEYWSTYLFSRGFLAIDDGLMPYDVAAMMILMKMSRVATSPNKRDHWVDTAGYSACGAECVE